MKLVKYDKEKFELIKGFLNENGFTANHLKLALDKSLKKIESLIYRPSLFISDYFFNIRNFVDLIAEKLNVKLLSTKKPSAKINQSRGKIIAELAKHETDALNNFKFNIDNNDWLQKHEEKKKAFEDRIASLDAQKSTLDIIEYKKLFVDLYSDMEDLAEQMESELLQQRTCLFMPLENNRNMPGVLIVIEDAYLKPAYGMSMNRLYSTLNIIPKKAPEFEANKFYLKKSIDLPDFALPNDFLAVEGCNQSLAMSFKHKPTYNKKLNLIQNLGSIIQLKVAESIKNDDCVMNLNQYYAREIVIMDLKLKKIDLGSSDYFKYLREIVIANTLFERLDAKLLGELRELRELTINSTRLTDIDENAFDNLTKLTTLDLRVNQISELKSSWFKSLKNLNKLCFAENQIKELPGGIFSSLKKLNNLNLSRNKLTEIKKVSFEGFFSLKYLILDVNQITRIEPKTFDDFADLRVLRLTNNQLTQIDPQLLKNHRDLDEIFLDFNQIETLDKHFFKFNTKLQNTSIRGNPIKSLHPEFISSLKGKFKISFNNTAKFPYFSSNGLQILNIRHTSQSELNKYSFGTLPMVNSVILKFTDISKIEENAFKGITSLENLRIEHSKLTSLNSKMFNKLPSHFARLSVNHNRIASIDHDTFKGRRELKILYLNHNRLTTLEESTFHQLEKLGELNLSHNMIEELPINLFRDLKNLNILQLAHNRIQTLSPKLFENFKLLMKIDIQRNSLTKLTDPKLFKSLRATGSISLAHNLIDEISLGIFDLSVLSLDLSYNNLTQLHQDMFVKTELRSLNLEHNYISLSTSNPFNKLNFAYERLINLDLSSNKIGDLKADMFSSCQKVTTLYLNHNEIKKIDKHAFRGLKLKELHLDDNLLTEFDTNCIAKQTFLEELSLEGNNLKYFKLLRKNEDKSFKSLKYLYLNYNNITHLGEYVPSEKKSTKLHIKYFFSFFKLNKLKRVDLSHNMLRVLGSGTTFKRMSFLRHLNLSHNLLASIHPDAFLNFFKLFDLDLSHNKLKELHTHVFINQSLLAYVNLSSNQLEYINIENLFYSTNLLARLDLSSNRLDERTINKDLFKPLQMSFDQINTEITKLPVKEKILRVKLNNNVYDYEKDEAVMNELKCRYGHAFYNQRFLLN